MTTPTSGLKVIEYDHDKHHSWASAFADLHLDCMSNDGTIAHFTRPWDKEAIARWWRDKGKETQVTTPEGARDKDIQSSFRIFWFVTAPGEEGEEELAGMVMLSYEFSQTEGSRGNVEKLLVSPRHRGKGIARLLMETLEKRAIEEKRTFLMLDTETGSPAEKVYPKLGYKEIGKIPEYNISPVNGELMGGTFFYKILPGHRDHQKVVLELDFSGSLWGYTEITILPTTADLTTVHLHSRQCTIHNVTVAAKPAEFTHYDPVANIILEKDAKDIHRHKELKRKVYSALSESEEGELSVAIPEDVPLKPGNGEVDVMTPMTAQEYLPIVINVTYSLRNPVDGIEFVKPSDSYPYRIPHMYTTPSSADAARCWVPCVDNPWEKCTWEFEFIVPRYLEDRDATIDEDQVDAHPTLVVCSGELVEQVAHPYNSNKSIFLFSQASLTSAQHIAFAAGPFHLHSIPFDNGAEEANAANSQQPLMYAFCLPGQEAQLSASTSTLRHAMTLYSNEFGSYPYSSYKLVFVDELPVQRFDSATLSLVSVDMLHGEDSIEQAFETRQALAHALACQWMGVNVQPKMWSDLWLVNGLAAYMTGHFIKKLFGNNEYRFRLKKDMNRVYELDAGPMPPICQPTVMDAPGPEVLPFINLKAPLILHILDRKLGKSGTALGLSRVLPKLFLTAISGEMVNNLLSTHYFLRLCRKVSGVEVRAFAEQWIYGSGCPSFHFTASFNRKKMAVEINMRQHCAAWAANEGNDAQKLLLKPVEVFEGTMTVRIHEADGTPYEHVLDIRSAQKRYEVPFNTKYKRVRRNTKRYLARQAAAQAAAEGDAEAAEAMGMVDMGFGLDIWEREDERSNWKVADWTEDDENTMSGATYEWIRMDADFEWIADLVFEQPDFMWVSQLQRDRDVVAQLEALTALMRSPTAIVSSTLTKTVLVTNYFFRIRCAAASALVECAIRKLDFLGLFHLFKLFLRYCYEPEDPAQDLFNHSYVPKPNNFSDLPEYFVRKSLVTAISRVRFENGRSPAVVRQFLIDQLRYNDNTSNPYSDGFYICTILAAASGAVISTAPPEHGELMPTEGRAEITAEDANLLKMTIAEVDRYRSMDRLIPSHHNIVTVACLEFYLVLSLANLIPSHPKVFFPLTREGNYTQVRMAAFDGLFMTKWYTPAIARYVLAVMANDPSRDVRRHVARNAVQSLALMFQMGEFKTSGKDQASLLIEEDGSRPEQAREQKKTEVDLMIRAIRKDREAGKNEVFRDFIMPIALASDVDHEVRWCILKMADILVRANDETPPPIKILLPSAPTVSTPTSETASPLAVRPILKKALSTKATASPKPPTISLKPPKSVTIPTPDPLSIPSPSTPVTPSITPSKPKGRPPKQPSRPTQTAPRALASGMSETDLKACRAALNKLQTNKHSLFFRQPVDPVRDQAPSYFEVIKRPMDLGTMMHKLNAGQYRDRAAFRSDFGLMISNAKQYNPPGTLVHKEAIQLETFFEKQWSKISNTLAAHNKDVRPEPAIAPTSPALVPASASSPAPSAPKIKLSLGRAGSAKPIESKAVPRKIKGPVKEPEPEDAPPPYVDDGSADLLEEVIAVEQEQKKKRPLSGPLVNGSSSKRKIADVDEDEELLDLASTSKRQRPSSPEASSAPRARVIVPGPRTISTPPAAAPAPSAAPSVKGKERARSPARNSPRPQGIPINEKKCKDLLRTITNDAHSLIFRQPVDPIRDGCPTYFDEIKQPMDLQTMGKKLASHQYQTMEAFRSDMELIFKNCRQFNPPGTYPIQAADTVEILFKREWPKTTEKKLTSTERRSLIGVVLNLMKEPSGWVFAAPVDPVLLGIPTYFEIIPPEKARDLRTIKEKLEADKYDNVDAVEADLNLMIQNAITFNGPDSEVGQLAQDMQSKIRSSLAAWRSIAKKRKDGGGEKAGSQPSKRMKFV